MDKYEIKEIDLQRNEIRKTVNKLISEVFDIPIDDEKLIRNTFTKNGRSLYLAAYHNHEIAAVNFFIAHSLMINGENVVAHQSCWSATSKKHRKRGLFSKLINHAKTILAQQGSAFIFGFPNVNSSSIFLKNLGFYTVQMSKVNLLSAPLPKLVFKTQFKNKSAKYNLNVSNHFMTIESEIIELKKAEYGEEIKVFGAYNNLIWGKVKMREWKNVKVKFFLIGGVQINKPHLLNALFETVCKELSPNVIQIVGTVDHLIWKLVKGSKSAYKTEPLIIFDLNRNTKDLRFSFINGIKDVF